MSTQICRGFTDSQWQGLKKNLVKGGVAQDDAASWDCAIKVFERRMRERFLSCIEALQRADSKKDVEVADDAPPNCSTLPKDDDDKTVVPGFAILALCCLLVETLASFRDAPAPLAQPGGPCPYPQGNCIKPQPPGSGKRIRDFLQRPSFGGVFADPKVARDFYDGIRCAIFHDAETRHWLILRERPKNQIVERDGDQYILNRAMFYQALRQEFDSYLGDLGNSNNVELRKSFVEKMDNIVEKC